MNQTDQQSAPPPRRSKFPPLYWLVVFFEFVERGSYYGMMSVLSVYMTDVLHFARQDVGTIKATIQSLLYFLPIISGALADRLGFRPMLMVAFGLLGGGYLLTAGSTSYSAVFISLIVMGLGAGTFKPIISGTIARTTDASNGTLGFGIFYWAINLGAFLVPLFLVPFLKNNIGWDWVILAAAIGTGSMLLPTLLFYKEPPARLPAAGAAAPGPRPGLLQTLASAFEIIYSPLVLLVAAARRRLGAAVTLGVLGLALLGGGAWLFLGPGEASAPITAREYRFDAQRLRLQVQRNLSQPQGWELSKPATDGAPVTLTLYDPDHFDRYRGALLAELRRRPGLAGIDEARLAQLRQDSTRRVVLELRSGDEVPGGWHLASLGPDRQRLSFSDRTPPPALRQAALSSLQAQPPFAGLTAAELDDLIGRASSRSFLLGFIGLLLAAGLVVLHLAPRWRAASAGRRLVMALLTFAALQGVLWALPDLTLFARLLCGVIATTSLALFGIETEDTSKFRDHFRFLLMIVIYSGFWVLYFQMFDSVLWYVKAYVDASSLNAAVNTVLGLVTGGQASWRFDVEHVTVINAGTIILLQLLVSNLTRNTRALPTMIVGITLGTLGMAVLAVSTDIWVFIAGAIVFSLGEMTAHPKFISYVGQIAPPSRVAMYMGYLFLYGVVGGSVGSVVGANLYVKLVDEANSPRTLWLLFAAIGVATIIGLLLYDRLVGRAERPAAAASGEARKA